MIKPVKILTGWARVLGMISTSEPQKKLSELRVSICKLCPEAKTNKVLAILNGNVNYVNQLQCRKCKCPCLEKSLVTDEKCPIGKW